MAKKRAFISSDFDHDEKLRGYLVKQAKNPDSPFNIEDWSVKRPFTGNWKEKVRNRILRTDIVIVICGTHTHTATGVSVEVEITQEEGKSYFLLKGRRNKTCTKPRTALKNDKITKWTWENLRKEIEGKNLHDELSDGLGTLTPWVFAIGGLIWILDRKAQKPRIQKQGIPRSRLGGGFENHVSGTVWR